MESLPQLVELTATLLMVGIIWTVQLVVYPLFLAATPKTFPAHHAGHVRRIGPLVVTVMSVELVAAVYVVASTPLESVSLLTIGLLVLIWGSTILVQAPIHGRLTSGFDRDLVSRLIRTNWLRTSAWTARAALVLAAPFGQVS